MFLLRVPLKNTALIALLHISFQMDKLIILKQTDTSAQCAIIEQILIPLWEKK